MRRTFPNSKRYKTDARGITFQSTLACMDPTSSQKRTSIQAISHMWGMLLLPPCACMQEEPYTCNLLRSLQNTKSEIPQNTPQNTLRITSRNQNTKKTYQKHTKIGGFRNFFVFFRYFGFGRGFGCILGVYFGAQRGFVSCRGRRGSQPYKETPNMLQTDA